MKYCVVKNTTVVIDGSSNNDEVMIKNAIGSGYSPLEVEILTSDQYHKRESELAPAVLPKSELEILKEQMATNIGALDYILMNF